MSEFEAGAVVEVTSLRRRGRILERRGQRYRVVLGGLQVWADAADLRLVGEARPGRDQRRRAVAAGAGADAGPALSRSIDLHGLTAEEARETILAGVDRAARDGVASIEFIHGRGSGRLRQIVREVLSALGAVRHVRAHPSNPGITIAHL